MSRVHFVVCAIACTLALQIQAQAQSTYSSTPAASGSAASAVPTAPSYKTERWAEDYTYLRDPAARGDLFDPIKYIPLDATGQSYATFGGQIRDRYESFNHNTFGSGPQDHDGYNLARIDEYLDLHVTPYVRFFVDGRSAFENGRVGGPRGSDLDDIDPQQLFAEFTVPMGDGARLSVRAGRQELLFGAERLIGPADFNDVRRTFDGVRAAFVTTNNQLDVFVTRPVVIQKYAFDQADNNTAFSGIYDTLRLPNLIRDARSQLEVYGLQLRRSTAMYPTIVGAGHEDRYTGGTRFSSNPKPFDLDVEADYQWGNFKGDEIRAYSLATELGYTLASAPATPRTYVGFDIASGNHQRNGGDLDTFNQLFPTGHTYFGYIDAVGRQNIIDLHPGVKLFLLKDLPYAQDVTLKMEYHQFWRQSTQDALYSAAGAVLRPAGASTARDIGSEVDLLLNWQINRHWSAYAGYSHFFHGAFIQQTGAAKDIDFAYAAVTLTF